MPMCSMEQKRCISVASRVRVGCGGVTREKNEREKMELTTEVLKIFTLPVPSPRHQYFTVS